MRDANQNVTRIKTVSLNVIAKLKSENPDFDIDFETFVKELSTDEVVNIVMSPAADLVQQVTRVFESLIKDSFKRTKRHSNSAPAASSSSSPGPGETRFARLIQAHQFQQRLATTRNANEQEPQGREATMDGTRHRMAGLRSAMDVDDRESSMRLLRGYGEGVRIRPGVAAGAEEDKDEENPIVENREIGLGTVVLAYGA